MKTLILALVCTLSFLPITARAEMSDAVLMTGVVKSYDGETVTVLSQGRVISIPQSAVKTETILTGEAVIYELTSKQMEKFFFSKRTPARKTSSTKPAEEKTSK